MKCKSSIVKVTPLPDKSNVSFRVCVCVARLCKHLLPMRMAPFLLRSTACNTLMCLRRLNMAICPLHNYLPPNISAFINIPFHISRLINKRSVIPAGGLNVRSSYAFMPSSDSQNYDDAPGDDYGIGNLSAIHTPLNDSN